MSTEKGDDDEDDDDVYTPASCVCDSRNFMHQSWLYAAATAGDDDDDDDDEDDDDDVTISFRSFT